ncbi:hypothetical protein HZU72_18230 [Halomonas sp. QX-2]|uniref:Alpha/beta hydrolase n=1 Tax=Vreelandella sedimenti TaxID=2729618 RepID=A0A7Z0SN33_9GAMM|nr:hypothetical protein [Halomonas sedimenti]NYT74347.1 hypothetical protein [Halomonas sedimenti]
MVYISDYAGFIDNKARETHVIFSSANMPRGKLSGTRVFIRTDVNYIFLNCIENSWFLNGVIGFGKDLLETIDKLKLLIKELGDHYVVFYGGSMGGYGALLYGLHIRPHRVVATGVEYILGIKGGFFNKHCLNKNLICTDSSNEYLYNLVNCNKEYLDKVFLIYGERAFSDLICALKMSSDGFSNIFTIVNEDHSIPPFLTSFFDISDLISSKDIYSSLGAFSGNIVNYPDFVNACYEFYVNKNAYSLLDFKDIENLPPLVRSYYYFYRFLYEKKKGVIKASFWLERAIYLNRSCPIILYNYADYMNLIGDYNTALMYSKLSYSFYVKGVKPLYNAQLSCIESLINLENHDEAIKSFALFKEKISKSALNNPHIALRITKIESRLGI